MPRPENRCRHGVEPPPVLHALHALRSEAFAEDLPEPTRDGVTAPAPAASGTMPTLWWRKVFDADSLKSGGVVGLAAGPWWRGRPA
jgi:hypothetical protein